MGRCWFLSIRSYFEADGSHVIRFLNPLNEELAAAMKRIGELTMDNEVLRARVGHVGPLARRRLR